jgi:amino-acid N-acetyltransferase
MSDRPGIEPFSEKGFYLSEFRGRTLAIAARAEDLLQPAPLELLLKELETNATRVVLLSTERRLVERIAGGSAVAPAEPRFAGRIWRALLRRPRVGVAVEDGAAFPRLCREIVLELVLSKLLWVDPGGGVRRPEGGRRSFVDLEELRRLLAEGVPGETPARRALLVEIEQALAAGLAAVNLSTLEGLADELFTYAGTGTLLTRERYVEVRRLGLDDYDAAHHLIARGVEEAYLAPRPPEQVEQVLACGFGAFVEGRHLAGIGALLEHAEANAAEIVSLYTLTRFLGEGIGAHLIRFALERARNRRARFVFACTTSERVAGFFERHGFRVASPEEVPAVKWQGYDPVRRLRLRCLRIDLS